MQYFEKGAGVPAVTGCNMTVNIKGYAKINLFLDILGKMKNGYHSLFMIMQTVSLYDEITLDTCREGIELICSDRSLPTDEKNIAYKAAMVFFEKTGIKSGVKITIKKNIPVKAGLAGGSADAAAVIMGLNEIFGKPLNEREMCFLGLACGSDVPFAIKGGTCLSQGRGGLLSPLRSLPPYYIVVVKPGSDVQTSSAFAAADSVRLFHPDINEIAEICESGDYDTLLKKCENVFEQVIEVPERVEIKRIMSEHGSLLSQMSGSGPSVFGIFENECDANKAAEKLKKICPFVAVTRPVSFR